MDKVIQQEVTQKFDPHISHQIETAMLSSLYQQAKIGLLASLFCAGIIFIFLYPLNNHAILFSWYGFFLAVTCLRLLLVNSFLKENTPQKNWSKNQITLWRNMFSFGAFLSGISWGLPCSNLLLPSESAHQMIPIVILAGMTAGSVPLLAPVRSVAAAFLIPAMLPLIFYFISSEESMHLFLVSAFSIYLIYLIVLSFKIHALIKNSITLQFENSLLLKNLSKTRNQLELANVRLKQDATHDPLTRVANRSLFEAKLQEAITNAANEKKLLALLYLDLDNFKQINDRYGHDAGDQLLLVIISRLKNILREKDIIARLGGDEFAIILENLGSVKTITDVADRICQTIAEPIRLGTSEIQEHASIGISFYPENGSDMSTLLSSADKAMYDAKQHGGNRYCISQSPAH